MKWTREAIEEKLSTQDRWVERAMVALWERQTADEQISQTASHHNGRGFAGWSSRSGSYYAEWVRSGRRLSGKHLVAARRIALYHSGQLTAIANANTCIIPPGHQLGD